jgi:hypothetical protein
MRRIRVAAVRVMVAAGLVGAVAAPASAAKPANYGTCVKMGELNPAESIFGPMNVQGRGASDLRGGGIQTGIDHSGGKPRFQAQIACEVV